MRQAANKARIQQHRPPVALVLEDDPAELRLHQRVEARGRLVEQQQLHLGRQRGDEGDLLPVALRVGPALLRRVEVEALQQGVPPAAVQPAEPADQPLVQPKPAVVF